MTTPRIEFLIAASALGAATAMFIGFVMTTAAIGPQQAGIIFSVWISQPQTYWPWPLFGAIIGALTFWVGALISGR